MNPIDRIRAYASHPDPAAAACNRIALLVASNQPIYPFYLLWLVGGDWLTACWTSFSTPLFASVPFTARRNSLLGRAQLPATGIFNGIVSAKAFGADSGVDLFLIPCALITLLAFRDSRRTRIVLLAALLLTALLHGRLGPPFGRFTPEQYTAFRHLNLYSVIALSIFVVWSLFPARASAPRN